MRLTLQHTTRSRAQRTSASLKEKEKKREKEKDDDDEDAEDAEDVVRSAILPKKKKRVELSRVDQVSRV